MNRTKSGQRYPPLGDRQKDVLLCLVRHGLWPGGWVWGTSSETQQVLESLVLRGYATKECRENPRNPAHAKLVCTYRPTSEGESQARELSAIYRKK